MRECSNLSIFQLEQVGQLELIRHFLTVRPSQFRHELSFSLHCQILVEGRDLRNVAYQPPQSLAIRMTIYPIDFYPTFKTKDAQYALHYGRLSVTVWPKHH